jgi:hypothetical protein
MGTHANDTKAGYGVLIAFSGEQTEANVSRFELLAAALDCTFNDKY